MKKLVILSLIAFFALGSAKAFAQDALAPHAGEAYDYWVNTSTLTDKTSGQDATHVGSSYTWYVTKGDLTTTAGTDVSITAMSGTGATYADASTPVLNLYGVNVTWNPAAINSGDKYYLHVVETDAQGCSNHKVEVISPANAFEIQFASLKEDGTWVNADVAYCAPTVGLSLASATNVVYDYGYNTLYYEVTPSGLASNYSFKLKLAALNIPTGSTFRIEYKTAADTTGGTWTQASISNVNDEIAISNVDFNNPTYIRMVIHNGATDGTYNDGTTSASFIKLDVNTFSDGSNAPVAINGNTSATNATYQQTVNKRPNTSGIQH